MSGFATVGEVYDDGLTLIFDGEEEPTEKHYKCNTSVIFHAGDRVRILEDSGTFVVEYVVGVPMDPDSELHGLPTGGSTGQVLAKASDNAYDATWTDAHGIPAGGSSHQILRKSSNENHAVEWADPNGLPTGGSAGQYLKKTGPGDGEAAWAAVEGAIPKGGSAGQALVKSSSTDYAATWEDRHEIPAGGTANQILRKKTGNDYSVEWADPIGLPTGGSTGQVLTKSGSGNYVVKWQDVVAKSVANQIDATSATYAIQLRTTSKYGSKPVFQIRMGSSGTWYTLTTE